MAAVVGITLIKQFTYRLDTQEQFSNQYWLDGSVPADATAWNTLISELGNSERQLFPSSVKTVKAYAYDSDVDDADSVYQWDFGGTPLSGGLTVTGGLPAPGDSAVWIRWKTSRLNSKGKAIYLRKYYHPAYISSGSGGDAIFGLQKTGLDAFGNILKNGLTTSGRKIRSQKHPETILSTSSSDYVTTRTLKRRGKRPGS